MKLALALGHPTPQKATKTGLTRRSTTEGLSHNIISTFCVLGFAVVIVAVTAFAMQRVEIHYQENKVQAQEVPVVAPARDSEESSDILLPPNHSRSIQLTSEEQPIVDAWLASAKTSTYAASLKSQTAEVVRLEPGRAFTLEVKFKNTGTATWQNAGEHFVALNVAEPAGRTSQFRHSFWREYAYRPTRLMEPSVAPGETGTFRFAVLAPDAPGRYTESFALVAENLEWISGGEVTFTMVVNNPYKAKKLSSTTRVVQIDPGKAMTLELQFQNTGTKTWTRNGNRFVAMNVTDPAGRNSAFRHEFWNEHSYRPTRLMEPSVAPGETGTFRFAVLAPETEGLYTESFGLVAEDYAWIEGGNATYSFQVGDPKIDIEAIGDPKIRVGLTSTLDPIVVAGSSATDVYIGKKKFMQAAADAKITLEPRGQELTVSIDKKTTTTKETVRMVATNNGVISVLSYENRPGWNTALNDNTFRGVIEVRWSTKDSKYWVINELPMEHYLAGIAETSNGNPMEYLKSLAIASRSYAYYHYNRGVQFLNSTLESTKHGGRGFHVHTTYDQVYRGYEWELRAGDIAKSVQATRGLVVSYEGVPVITPYFSHSDGRTRAWEEVWYGGPYPWLQSVPDPYCTDKPLFGHGVGMSALGALHFAYEEGWSAEKILSYYYKDTELMKLY
ncbi:MAG: SpoIID/LytB domain-containing protein [Patescibacteria group bacterium]|jgi:hypothetical protein